MKFEIKMKEMFSSWQNLTFKKSICNENRPCLGNYEFCNSEKVCECFCGHEYDSNGVCIQCEGYNQLVSNCDKSLCTTIFKSESNITTCICTDNCSNHHGEAFVTASQIALSAALLMGILALAMVVYRLCTKPKYLTARQRAAAANRRRTATANRIDRDPLGAADQYNLFRCSLTSMQIRVLSRLRDRPPAYRNESSSPPQLLPTGLARTNDPRSIIRANSVENGPPPYETIGETEANHCPPPYVEIILSPNGYMNQTFDNSDETPTTVLSTMTTTTTTTTTTANEIKKI